MATYTPNYNLNKPTFAELADVRTFNGNMDIIDTVMNATQNSIAEPYDSTETYDEGDMVMYELYLYKCLEETTGTWDATKWERAYSASSGAGIVYPQDATKYLNGAGQWTVPAGSGGGVNYSTTEQVIGTWIDGSTIYQKTWYETIPTYDSSIFGCLVDTGFNYYDEIIEIKGCIKESQGASASLNGLKTNGWKADIHVDRSGNVVLYADSANDLSAIIGGTVIVTIQYTKPTV